MISHYIEKIRQGKLREIWRETAWIYGYTAQYKKAILLYIFLGLLSTVFGLGGSIISKVLIDAVTAHRDSVILQVAALYVGFALARILLSALTRRVNARLSIQASNEIRADVFSRFLNVDWQASLDYHSGDLLTRVNSDVETVSGSILGWIPSLITGLVQFIATFCVILAYDPVMALIALLSAPVTLLLSQVFLSRMRRFGREVREAQAKLTAFYEEALQNLQAIKAFHLNQEFSGRLEELQGLYRDISLDYNLFSIKANLLMSVTGFVVSGLCFLWAVYRLWSGMISFGTMLLFIQLAGLVSSTFASLVSLVPAAVSATVSAGRIMTILDLPREELDVTDESRRFMEQAAEKGVELRMEDLHFAYQNGREVFSGFSLCAKAGEIVGIVSPSGGGKTTLIRMLLGLISPSGGQIILSSGGASAPLSPCMRSLISYVAQEKVVFSGTVADSLNLCGEHSAGELRAALESACAWDFVSALPKGVDTPLGERGSGLSEGQIQRLAIARAILSDAPVMLLDEATSALDMETERKLLHNMLKGEKRRTVIVTTHRPTVLSSCDRVYAIRDGKAARLTEAEIDAMLKGQ